MDYQVPIISQQGEVCGKLHIQVYRLSNKKNEGHGGDLDDSGDSSTSFLGKKIKCRVKIKKATNLPQSLNHFVFCQYSFFNISEMLVVAPIFDDSTEKLQNSTTVKFDHQKDFEILVTEEFLEYVQDDALSIEIWGHRSSGLGNDFMENDNENETILLKQKGLQERWSEVTNRVELWIELKELNENGEYSNVEVDSNGQTIGGIYQLKQGQQRRITIKVKTLPNGSLPINFIDITSISIGSVMIQDSTNEKELDSYQEEDLDKIREQWTSALSIRQKYLEEQINSVSF